MERCKLNDISNLKGLKNLSELRLVDNNIENIESLRDLKSLKILTLRGNLINDYSPVSGYYNNLVEKDFSLLNNDLYISIPNINTNKTIETIFINSQNLYFL